MQDAGFTVIEQAAKIPTCRKKLALWKRYATRGEYDMFPELKHYSYDKEVNIKQTVIGHLKMLAQKFEDYYGEDLTPSDENYWILDPFAGTDLPHLPLHITEEFMDMTTEATNRISFATLKEQYLKTLQVSTFGQSSVSNSFQICDKKIDSVCDNLDLRNCI